MLHQSLAIPLATLLSLLDEPNRKLVRQLCKTAKKVRLLHIVRLHILVDSGLSLREPVLDVLISTCGSLESGPGSTKLGRVSPAIAHIALDFIELLSIGQEDFDS